MFSSGWTNSVIGTWKIKRKKYDPVLWEQDKSSDIEQQPPFGDRKISNIQPQGDQKKPRKPTENSKKHLKQAKEVESLNRRWNT